VQPLVRLPSVRKGASRYRGHAVGGGRPQPDAGGVASPGRARCHCPLSFGHTLRDNSRACGLRRYRGQQDHDSHSIEHGALY